MRKIKDCMLANPSLLLGINTNTNLTKKYHDYASGEPFKMELFMIRKPL